MNGPVSDGPEEPVWERPWSLEEIGRSSQNWSLAADAGLLNFLQEFSHQTISRTHEIEKQLDGLVHEAKSTECRLHNIFNDFLMLSNTQFIENRVYDEEVEEHVVKSEAGEKPEQEKTREQKEVELIPKIQEAVNYGLQVLETAFEQLDIKAGNSDSEDEEVNERVELILEPKDLYIDRPLPYLIGSQLFMQQEDVGLGDVSSEEGSVDNDRGSAIDSEEDDDKDNDEESEEDFGNISEEEKKLRHPALSDEEEDNGSDLFGDSDKEDEDDKKSMKTRTKSFADELAARIQSEIPKRQETEQSSISVEVKNKKDKEAKEVRRLPSDDEEDDLFKPPKLTDEDFFGNKGGLFSGGKGLFDDDDDDDDEDVVKGDLFSDVQKKDHRITESTTVARPETLPSDVKKKPPYGGVSLFPGGENVINSSVLTEKDKRKQPTPTSSAPKPPASVGLFDDDDIFGAAPMQATAKAKQASDLFADDDDLFDDRHSINSATPKSKDTETLTQKTLEKKNIQIPTEKTLPSEPSIKRQTKGLFSDEEDSESDLFSPSQAASKTKVPSVPATKTSKSLSLFDDDDDEFFGSTAEKKMPNVASKPEQKSAIPAEVKTPKSGLFSSDEEDPVAKSINVKPVEKSKTDAAVPPKPKKKAKSEQKSSLFDEEEDLFAITKESQKKAQRISLLFEDDVSNEELLFSSEGTKNSEQPEASIPVKEEKEKVSLVEDTDKKDEPKVKVQAREERLPPVPQNNEVNPDSPEESDEDLFASSPQPTKQTSKTKSNNVLSLFGDEDDDIEDHFVTNITQQGPGKDYVEKNTQGKSTGVFQDEELLFSKELQKDNDPDVDLFASTNKKSFEKPKNSKFSTGEALFCDDDNDDLFSSAKPKKPPKVQEKKTIIKKKDLETTKEPARPLEVNEVTTLKTEEMEKTSDPAPIKTKSPSSRIGKLQANLLINPAALLPGAVPKLREARAAATEVDARISSAAEDDFASKPVCENLEGSSFETPAQVYTLHNANKTRVKVGGKRRPPTRLGRKLASQDSGENEDLSPVSPPSAAKMEAGMAESNWRADRDEISTMKLSLSENDIHPRTHPKVAVNPLTPDVNDLFGSDLFADNSLPGPAATRQQKEESSGSEFSKKPFLDQGRKSSAMLFDGDGSDDDLFKSVNEKPKKTPQSSHIDKEPEDDLFGFQKPPKKVDSQPVVPKERSATSDVFEDDIFAEEAVKPVKKAKEKRGASEANLFDDNTDIFADFTHKPKEKKTKKKAEPKSIFDDDMDDIFSASVSNVKKTKSKSKATQQGSETKSDTKASTAFDDPLNVLGK